MKKILQHAWSRRGWLACLLWPVSQLYGLIIKVRELLYKIGFLKSTRVPVPVLVVGNVVAGGGGKTPLVLALVKHFQSQGLVVGVISRGYGRSGLQCQEVFQGSPAHELGDEPVLIKRSTNAPVFVASKRLQAVHALLAAYPDTQLLVCDDGLQHYSLVRDIEVVVFDDRGLGNGWLLPAGPLRETWSKTPSYGRDLVLHTGQIPAFSGFTSARQLAPYALAPDGRKVLLSSLEGKSLVAVAAIANPDAFFDMLEAFGLNISQKIILPDHYDFLNYVFPVKNDATVLCTEKDAVKLFGQPQMSSSSIDLLSVPLLFAPEPAFLATLDARLAPLLTKALLSQLPSSHGYQTAATTSLSGHKRPTKL